MKKTLLISGALFASILTSSAQNQFPNGDFEDWTTLTPCPNLESPEGYLTADAITYYVIANTGFAICNPTPSISKSTDAYSGTYALRMTATNMFDEISSNALMLGDDIEAVFEDESLQSLPFTGRPVKLTGYYKFTQGGSDQISMQLFIANETEAIAHGELEITSSTSEYTKFEIALEYQSEEDPTELSFGVILRDPESDEEANAASVFLLDNLTFEYDDPVTSTKNFRASDRVNVYASSNQLVFSSSVSEVTILSSTGERKITENGNLKTLNASSLQTGIYIVNFQHEGNYYSKKIAIQ